MRTIARQGGINKFLVMRAIHELTAETKDSFWIKKNLKPKWSGVLSFDGKIVRVFDEFAHIFDYTPIELARAHKAVWLCGVDVHTKDLPHYQLGEEETMIDLVMYFQNLKKLRYPLKVLIVDGKNEAPRAARKVFGREIKIQLCNQHFIESLKRNLKDEISEGKLETEELIKKIVCSLRTRKEKINQERLQTISQDYSIKLTTPTQKGILKSLGKNLRNLTTHFDFKELKIPRDNNDIENLYRQLNLRLKSWGIFRNHQTARNYLKTWAGLRRFQPFTDCRGKNKLNNYSSPLQLAKAKIKQTDYLKL